MLSAASVQGRKQVARTMARLEAKCAKLYDARTSAARRSALSLEVSILRSRLLGVRDPLAAMTAASVSAEGR